MDCQERKAESISLLTNLWDYFISSVIRTAPHAGVNVAADHRASKVQILIWESGCAASRTANPDCSASEP
jgi:hypothetical protein